jgi:hypothetical protein
VARGSRGFQGRRPQVDPDRVPPGQDVTRDFPVLSAGPTPHTPLDEWTFAIRGAVEYHASWSWEEFVALPSETFTVDIHCVTKWSKLVRPGGPPPGADGRANRRRRGVPLPHERASPRRRARTARTDRRALHVASRRRRSAPPDRRRIRSRSADGDAPSSSGSIERSRCAVARFRTLA